MIRRSTLLAVEILLGLVAALIIGLGITWWRLSQGPVELSFLRETVQTDLSQARSGRPVSIDRVELAWSNEGNALELRAVGVRVEDGRGHVLSRSDEARIELGVLPLLIGRVSLVRATFIGGEITVTHKIDGVTEVAFGPPGSPPDIILPANEDNLTLEQKVAHALDNMEEAFKPVGPGGDLRSVAARNTRLAIIDEAGGGRWTADTASFALSRDGDALTFDARARLEGAQGQAPASLRITTDTQFQSAIVEFGATNVRPRAIFSTAALGPFAGLDAPFTAAVTIGLDRRSGINRFEGDATLGRGTAEMAGGRFTMSGGRFHGRYDIDSDELIIDQLQLGGATTRINGEAHIKDVSRIMRAQPDQPAAFDIALPSLTLDVPGTFLQPVSFTEVQLQGAIVASERSIRFSRVHARTDEAIVDATGRFYWGEAGPEHKTYPGIELNGTVGGTLNARTVLAVWPMMLGAGTHHYLSESLMAGHVTNGRAMLDIRPSDFAATQFRDAALELQFDVSDGEFKFLQTMSPVTNARASGILRGNSFEMTIPEARLNGLALTNGHINIPHLRPEGDFVTITAHAEGEARNALGLLMQEPLNLRDRIPVDVASATGHASVNLRLQRPSKEVVTFEDWRFGVDGQLSNFAGTMTTRRVALANGNLRINGDQRALRITGPVRAGESQVNVAWTEYFNRPSRASSEYTISGNFDANDLTRLGYDIARYAQGRIGVTVSGQGRGFDVDQAHIELNLAAAAVQAPRSFWTKNANVAASASFDVARQRDGALAFNNIEATGGGLDARGSVRLTRDNRIAEADISRLAIEGRSDAHLTAVRAQDGGLDVAITGALFDGAPFMGEDEPPAEAIPTAAAAPAQRNLDQLRATVNVDRLKLRGGATLNDAHVQLSTQRGALYMLVAEGHAPGGKPFSLALGPRPTDLAGRLRFRSDDAGFAVRALTGADNVVGGTATAEGDWRPGPPNQARFDVRMRDFQVVRLPAMTRLLSSAGSLTGLVEMLNGDGIGFSAFDARVDFTNNRLTFTDGRMAGPSLGLTGSGAYDLGRDNLDIDGVLVPSYGLNSMLGAVPVIGQLFVSREGEGVFGMTYSVNGHVAEPRVGVNPLAALTPGILRRIFEPVAPRPNGGSSRSRRSGASVETPAPAPEQAPQPEQPAATPAQRGADAGAAQATQEAAAAPVSEAASPAP